MSSLNASFMAVHFRKKMLHGLRREPQAQISALTSGSLALRFLTGHHQCRLTQRSARLLRAYAAAAQWHGTEALELLRAMACKGKDDPAVAATKSKRGMSVDHAANVLLDGPLPERGSLYVDYLRMALSGIEMSVHFHQHDPEKADIIKKIGDDLWHLPASLCGEPTRRTSLELLAFVRSALPGQEHILVYRGKLGSKVKQEFVESASEDFDEMMGVTFHSINTVIDLDALVSEEDRCNHLAEAEAAGIDTRICDS
eukprot:6197271-Pleurochrysis_carterae.AAC.1